MKSDELESKEKLTADQALQLGADAEKAGNFQKAANLYSAILKKQPRNPSANHNLGLLAVKPLVRLKLFQTAFEAAPQEERYLISYLNALLDIGKKNEALSVLENTKKQSEKPRKIISEYERLLNLDGSDFDYQRKVLSMRDRFLEYPAHIHLETFAQCNAACSFCPYPEIDRKGTRMGDDLIEKVISDLEDIPKTHRFQLSPFKVNEPFLDKRIFDLLEKFQNRLPNAGITLTSNASPITENMLSRLAEFKNIEYLWISFNDHRKAEYEETMRLPFERTIQRLDMIHKKKTEGKFDTKTVLSRVGDATKADLEFREWVMQRYPLFESSVFQRGQWIGQVASSITEDPPNIGCIRWFDVSITATGVVAHCCMDGKAEYPIGNVNEQHILEIYNAPEYRKLREATCSRLEVEPSRGCSFL